MISEVSYILKENMTIVAVCVVVSADTAKCADCIGRSVYR